MSATYGKELKFVAFDAQFGTKWLSVTQAVDVCNKIGLEFVFWVKIPTDIKAIDFERDRDSEQAIRNGVGPGKKREGVVLRPLIEVTKNDGSRIISKHKRDEFRETATPREIDPAKLQILTEANAVADEWVTATRMQHVLDKLPGHCIQKMPEIIAAMQEDVLREGAGELVPSDAVKRAIGTKTAKMYKAFLQSQLK